MRLSEGVGLKAGRAEVRRRELVEKSLGVKWMGIERVVVGCCFRGQLRIRYAGGKGLEGMIMLQLCAREGVCWQVDPTVILLPQTKFILSLC